MLPQIRTSNLTDTWNILDKIRMKIKFNTQTSILHEPIGKSNFFNNNETGIRDDNKIAHKISKENPLIEIKTTVCDSDIPYAGIKNDNKLAHQTSKETPLSVIETSVKESVILYEPLTNVSYNKEKDLQQPPSTYLCNSASTQEVNWFKILKLPLTFFRTKWNTAKQQNKQTHRFLQMISTWTNGSRTLRMNGIRNIGSQTQKKIQAPGEISLL